MPFVIPMMFFACLEWNPPLDVVEGFRFEQPVTIRLTARHVSITHVEWVLPRFGCYAIWASGDSTADVDSVTVTGSYEPRFWTVQQ